MGSEVVAYVYDGEHYCEGCIENPDDEEVGAVFRWDEITSSIVCGGCGDVLYEYDPPFPEVKVRWSYDSGREIGSRTYPSGRADSELEARFMPPNAGIRIVTYFDEDDGVVAAASADFDR